LPDDSPFSLQASVNSSEFLLVSQLSQVSDDHLALSGHVLSKYYFSKFVCDGKDRGKESKGGSETEASGQLV